MKFIFISLLFFLNAFASDAFITADELKTLLKNPDLILLDVSKRSTYENGHIDGALHLDISKFTKSQQSRMAVNFSQNVQKELRRLGVMQNSKVVLYSRGQKEDLLNATYLAFILFQHGLENVTLLNGGYMAWVFKHHNLVSSKESKPSKKGTFEISHNPSLLISGDFPKTDSQKALFVPCSEIFSDDSTMKSSDILKANFIEKFDLKTDNEIIIFNHNIFEASSNWFVLNRVLGFKNIKICTDCAFE